MTSNKKRKIIKRYGSEPIDVCINKIIAFVLMYRIQRQRKLRAKYPRIAAVKYVASVLDLFENKSNSLQETAQWN